ncbi:MAG TPA: glycosyltransferase, partial [Nitrosarchaeum sp.]|nr:glycosyltransferase [Nitrosarchaeum sp.]
DERTFQKISEKGRIQTSRLAWMLRIVTLTGISLMIIYNLQQGIELNDPLIAYSTLMPLHALIVLCIGWVLYRNPAKGKTGNDLVSVIIPVFNQKSMIEIVIDAIYQSTYQNIEVIAVNDGSKDGTTEVLDNIAKKYPSLKVIHKKNEGKRKAVAAGFYLSKGEYVVLIDSDSVVDSHAIEEFMKTFNANPKIGAVVGYAKVWNQKKSFLTKCQDAWYDYAFNIHKTTESVFGTVMCCSGCLAGYRRIAISDFMPHWVKAMIHNSDDRDLTSYTIATPWAKKELAPFPKKLMKSMASYDDSEDRALTAQSLLEWKSAYVATAVVYTDVPEKWKGYLRQQTRWKKGYIRSNFFVSTFFWKKNPLMALIFYLEFMTTFTAPLITLIVLFYEPIILKQFWIPALFMIGSLLTGVAHGLDYRFRDGKTKNWKYKPIMNLIASFVLSWLVFPALWNFRKNEWLTR